MLDLAAVSDATTSGTGGGAWMTAIVGVLSLLFGSGGAVAWRKMRNDSKLGVAQQETAEDDAISARWKAIIETQTKVLLEPMQGEIASLKREMGDLQEALKLAHRKYWSAIGYIRSLYALIARHELEQDKVPAPPAILAEDIS